MHDAQAYTISQSSFKLLALCAMSNTPATTQSERHSCPQAHVECLLNWEIGNSGLRKNISVMTLPDSNYALFINFDTRNIVTHNP